MTRFQRTATTIFWVLFSASSFALQGTGVERERETTTVCAISREPAKFNSHWVRIPAHIESDSFEYTGLVDSACQNVAISLDYSGKYKGHDELDKAIHSPWPGTVDKDISGVFIGRFEWHPTERVRRVLILKGVENLRVVKK
jgi:hypothetical protein